MRTTAAALAGVLMMGSAAPALAAPIVTLHPASEGIDHVEVTVEDSLIVIEEFWTGVGLAFIQFEDLDVDVIYTVELIIHNDSGFDWPALSLELLDPAGNANDAIDPSPLPDFVPEGFSTSNDFDGLSFAQAQSFPRSSTVWSVIVADEGTDARDFLQLSEGTLANGGIDELLTFGLRDLRGIGEGSPEEGSNSPFLLAHTVEEPVLVAEPAIAGLVLLGATALLRRRR